MANPKRWRCLTCGFAWPKEEPPEACPVCGAPRAQFVRIGQGKVRFLEDVGQSILDHLHPLLTHLPNGAMPAGLLFLYLALAIGNAYLERAAFYLLVLVTVAIPAAAVTGFRDWKRRYGGRKVPIFYRKMGLAAGLFVLAFAAAVLRSLVPDLFVRGGAGWWAYVVLVTALFPFLALLGHWGGKLVFQWRKFPKATEAGNSS